ncbi:MAG: lipoyl(octanoyl) transferase LipB [Muribaculaceae bacterium]|nr:lipoyl(octanoyl) transferase LipB [Muribaculaceae bacterium]
MKTVYLPRCRQSYREILALQQEEFRKRIESRKNGSELPEDIIFFVEHRPVYTLGRHGKPSHLLLPEDMLLKRGIEFVETDRGGDITYHGPGQLTVYPIIDMLRHSLGVKDYVNLLEEAVIRTIADFGIHGERIEGRTGVWIGKDTPEERKISAIGVRCSRHVTMHGLALNVGSDISLFGGIVPCGLSQGVTSISKETGREVMIEEAKERLEKHLTDLLL